MDCKNIGIGYKFIFSKSGILKKLFRAVILAGRNLTAHWRKTWAIVAAAGLGVCALILVGWYYENNFWGLKQSLIRSQYGHLQIYPEQYREYQDTEPFRYSVERSAGLVSLL